jgi:glycosyltransferase involved in cell wall biosynthesis
VEPLVSVIIPVYNAGKYIESCVLSVIQQNYRNFEIVLVNDGSTDSSMHLCRVLSQKDERIKIINKENTGVSDSRNRGLDISQGEYVIFLDADDYWCDDTFLEKMVHVAVHNNLDIVRGEYKAVDEQGELLFCRTVSAERLKFSNKQITSFEFFKYAINGEFFIYLSLFRKSVFDDVRFENNRIFLEDMRLYSQILIKEFRCMYIPQVVFYAYRKYHDNVSSKTNPKKLEDSFDMCEFFEELSYKTSNENLKSYFQNVSITMYFFTLETVAYGEYYTDCEKYIYDFDLKTRRHNVCKRMSLYGIHKKSVIYYIPPLWGIRLFRVKHRLALIKKHILLKLKRNA